MNTGTKAVAQFSSDVAHMGKHGLLRSVQGFVGGIERKKRLLTREPVMIQNPHARLKSDPRFQVQPSNMLVEANICGILVAEKATLKNKST